jgi:hypothetical protein
LSSLSGRSFYCLLEGEQKYLNYNKRCPRVVSWWLLDTISTRSGSLWCVRSWFPSHYNKKQAHKYKHSLIGLSADACPQSGPIPPAYPVRSQPAHTPPAGQTSHVPPQSPFGLPVTKRLLHSKTEHVNDGSYHCHSTSDPNHSPLLLLHAVPILTPNSKIGLII